MSANVHRRIPIDADEHNGRQQEKRDLMLAAIANAIAAGRLPPDDACAWARIAAYEVGVLDVRGR